MRKLKTSNSKIEQNKTQYDLDRQAAKISDLSSGNVNKYEFLNGKDVLLEKDLLEKVATLKIFEYFPLGKELRAQTDIAKKENETLDKIYEANEAINKKPTFRNYSKSGLTYDGNYSF